MSFSEQLATAIAAARTTEQITALNQDAIAAWGASILSDDALEAAQEALEARKRSFGGAPTRALQRRSYGLRRPPRPRSPDREASIRRRRREIAPSLIPPQIAEHFTPGQLAALAVIARDIAINGQCAQCVDRLAAVAGVCPRLVQTAQRLAEQMGFLSIEARPRPGRKSDTNIIRIVCAEWQAWLSLVDRVQKNASHGKRKNNSTLTARQDSATWRFDPAASAPLGLAKGWSREATPSMPRHPRLEAALARSAALLAAGRAP